MMNTKEFAATAQFTNYKLQKAAPIPRD